MKNIAKGFAMLMVLAIALSSCGGGNGAGFEDGVYFAMEDGYSDSGWRYNVTMVVEDGEVSEVSWNGSNINGGVDKVTLSENGGYPMVERGGAMAEWHVQAKTVEDFFLAEQSTEQPDAISGASIHFDEFYALVNEAVEAGSVGYGPYRDGNYTASDAEFHNGWKYFVDITVISGYAVSAHWDAEPEEEGTNKAQRSKDGEYGMVENGGAIAPWWEQARAVEEAFIASQSTDAPDAISGATITIGGFFELAEQALAGAQR
jgi:major membrane immunogen (membrane-anchored lipoprotein)